MTPERRAALERQAEAFYWAGHMNGRMPNPAASAEALTELLHADVKAGKKKVLGQRSYKDAFARERIPRDKWVEQVKRALEKGFPVSANVRAEAGV